MQEVPNLNYIRALSGDAVDFEQRFIGVLKDEFPEEAHTYKQHIEKKELEMAAEMVHKLKHKFNILSMSAAYVFAVNYEEALREGKTELHADFLIFLDTIKNYLKTI